MLLTNKNITFDTQIICGFCMCKLKQLYEMVGNTVCYVL